MVPQINGKLETRDKLAAAVARIHWTMDPEGRVTAVSDPWREYTGLTIEETNRSDRRESVFHPEDGPALSDLFRESLRTGTPCQCQGRLRRQSDGEYRWFLLRVVPDRDDRGRIREWLGVAIDIHDSRNDAHDKLKDADRRKDEFLARLAHELRNPLAPLSNGLQLMRLCRDSRETIEEIQTMMERQLLHLVRLVDDLLDASRISRGKVELRSSFVTLDSVIRSAAERIGPTASIRGHELLLQLPEQPFYLQADPVRLAQVFSNLLDNACKYTLKPGSVRLSAEREGDFIAVTVADDGIGIPPESLESIFDLFNQLEPSGDGGEGVHGGLGIGLSLVKGLVELHGGTVEARSDGRDRGSAFVVRLPLAGLDSSARPSSKPSSGTLGAPRAILVVDDNRDSAESLARILQAHGHQVRTAFDGASAIDAARAFRPSFILLDIGMPGLDGYETARRIREETFGREAILIAMTGWGQKEDRKLSGFAGFDAHLTKPVDVSVLCALLERERVGRSGIA
jgi:PAS domain S-box-containing protein